MNRSMLAWATSRSPNDQPLTEAARLALEADPTPRMVKIIVDHDGSPIEITGEVLRPQLELPV